MPRLRGQTRLVGLVLLLGVLVSACGGATAVHGRDAVTAEQHHMRMGASAARARAYARTMLAALRLPPAARKTSWSPRSVRPMLPAPLSDVIDLRTFYRISWSIIRVDAFLQANIPPGLRIGDTGQASHAGIPLTESVDYNPRTPPPGIYQATVATTVVAATSGGSLIRVDAQVAWYPPRSAAEHLDAALYRAVIITAPTRHSGPPDPAVRTFASSTVIRRFATILNNMPAEPSIAENCGAMSYNDAYRLAFTPKTSQEPKVVVTTSVCSIDSVVVGGRAQPSLLDNGSTLIDEFDKLLGLTSTTVLKLP